MNINKIIKDAGYDGDLKALLRSVQALESVLKTLSMSEIYGDDYLRVRALIAIAREAAAFINAGEIK